MSGPASPPSNDSSGAEVEFDLTFPPIPLPSSRLLDTVGEPLLRALVTAQHERLRKSSIRALFPADQERFDAIVKRIANFVIDTIGRSPKLDQTKVPVWFRTRHLPMTIDETARNVWLGAMLGAFDDVRFPEDERLEFWQWVEALSIRAINRRTMISQPRRYPFPEAAAALRPFSGASGQK